MTQPPVLPPNGGGVQVRCAGCRMILTVGPGVTEFICPTPTCQLPQMLPPELMTMAASPPPPLLPPFPPPNITTNTSSSTRGVSAHVQNVNAKALSHVPAHGIDPTKIQLPCANCKAILNVPHGLVRFSCPQCAVELAVDMSKVKQFFPSPPPRLLPPPPEEVNEGCLFRCC